MPTTPTFFRRRRGMRTCALGTVGTLVLGAGVLTGAGAAFASTATAGDVGELASAFSAGVDEVHLTASFDDPGVVTLAPATGTSGRTTLYLDGNTVRLGGIQLTSDQAGTATGSNLVVTGSGALAVTRTGTSYPAIEVDAGSSLLVSGGTVTASVPAGSTAAAIGGGPAMGPSTTQASGPLAFKGSAVVQAQGGAGGGAAIGAGAGAVAGPITVGDDAQVSATGSGRGAAIGDGSGAAGVNVVVGNRARVEAHQTGTDITGAAIGGGASPTGQTAGSLTVGDEAQVVATSAGKGAAIGGGYRGDGGTVAVTGYAAITATADPTTGEAAIGDGDSATGGGTSVTIQNATTVVARGGGAGGAGIGGGANAYGNGSVTIGGTASVDASSVNGPGIGGQKNRNGLPVTIGGTASVTATGGGRGAAIGGADSFSSAFPSVGARVTIGAGTQVVLAAAPGVSALGAGTGTDFGAFSNAGTLTLPANQLITVPRGADLSNSGTFVNNGTVTTNGSLTNGGRIVNAPGARLDGAGAVANSGAIVQNGALTVPVSGSAFEVVYDSQGGTVSPGTQLVYADSLTAAQLALPSATPPSSGNFSGWNTSADGTGSALTSGASLAQVGQGSSTGTPWRFRVYALYQLAPVLPSASGLTQGVVGSAYSASVAATSGTAPITYAATGDIPAGLSLDTGSGAVTGTPTTAGTFTMHVTARNNAGSTTRDYTIQIVPTVLTAAVPSTPRKGVRYLAGGKLDLTLSGFQANEAYIVTIGGKAAALGKAPTNGTFVVHVVVPRTIGDGSQTVRVLGSGHSVAATATILTASVAKSLGLKLSATKAKKKVSITVSKLYAGESVRVVISGKHGKTAVGKASSKGGYVLTLKSGLAKGKYTVTVTGAGTGRKASAKLTVS